MDPEEIVATQPLDILKTMRAISELTARVRAEIENTTGAEQSAVRLLNNQLSQAHSTVALIGEIRSMDSQCGASIGRVREQRDAAQDERDRLLEQLSQARAYLETEVQS